MSMLFLISKLNLFDFLPPTWRCVHASELTLLTGTSISSSSKLCHFDVAYVYGIKHFLKEKLAKQKSSVSMATLLQFLALAFSFLFSPFPFTTSIPTPPPPSSPFFSSLSPGVLICSHLTPLCYLSFPSGLCSAVTATSTTSKGPV